MAHYEDIKKERLLKVMGVDYPKYTPKFEEVVKNEDEIYKVVFAPNPLTGFADSTLQMQLSKKTEREVREFLETFNRPLPPTSGTSDVDLALDLTQPSSLYPEAVADYYSKLSEIINSSE